MTAFLNQAKHNKDFHECICDNFDDGFFDWKITAIFYTALHYIKALAEVKKLFIGESHTSIMSSINPNNRTGAAMPLTYGAWAAYRNLYTYCHSARYNGITGADFDAWQKMKETDHKHCLVLLKEIEEYVSNNGVKLN
jgi:hypothetical protein